MCVVHFIVAVHVELLQANDPKRRQSPPSEKIYVDLLRARMYVLEL